MKPLRRRIERLESVRPTPVRDPAFDAFLKSLGVPQLMELLAEMYRQMPEADIEQELADHPYERDEIMRARGEPSDPDMVRLLFSVGAIATAAPIAFDVDQ